MDEADRDDAGVRAAMDAYLAAMNAGDYERAARSYRFPVASLSGAGTASFGDAAAFLAVLSPAFHALRARGFDRSVWQEIAITAAGSGMALASCRFDRLYRDGSLLETAAATYVLRREEERWWIVAVLSHPADTAIGAWRVDGPERAPRDRFRHGLTSHHPLALTKSTAGADDGRASTSPGTNVAVRADRAVIRPAGDAAGQAAKMSIGILSR